VSERPSAILALLVALAAALAAAIGAALAALGPAGIATLAATIAGALTACVFFLAELQRIPLSSLVLVALALASLTGGARTVWRYRRERRLLKALPLEPLKAGPLTALARQAGIRLEVTPARRPAAFCFGLVRPRIVITSGLLERLDDAEQAAVVWHEAEHARTHEPARCLLARLAANTFFWVPALPALLQRFLLLKELAADRRALARTGSAALAGALYEVASEPSLAAVGAGDLAAARIDRLFEPQAPLPPLLRRSHLLGSAAGIAALTLALAFPAQLDLGEQTHLHVMLTSLSVHGLPGMAAGLLLNATMLAGFTLIWRRLERRRSRTGATRR
jgi:Zn-dependent protease with chaperone function